MLEIQPDKHNEARRYCVGNVPAIDDVPLVLESVSTNYCLFLAIDASLTDDEAMRRMAKSFLERGIAYFCVWGPNCERVHDQFDLERKPREPKGQTVMTTWHSDESLSDALWFFANFVVLRVYVRENMGSICCCSQHQAYSHVPQSDHPRSP